MKLIVIVLGKLIMAASRLAGNSGSALPGLIAEKIHPRLLEQMLRPLPQGVIVVTGTNGKTTTTKMLVHMLSSHGFKVFTNKTGSNFTRGVVSSLIKEASLSGKLDFDIAVIELDEAYSPRFTARVEPRVLVALNVLRDQLDRYGEITATAGLIQTAAQYAKTVVLNADDPPIAALGRKLKHVIYFGVSRELRKQLPSDDELYGAVAQKRRPKPTVELIDHKPEGHDQKVSYKIDDRVIKTTLTLEGIYNAANAAAAITAAKQVIKAEAIDAVVHSLGKLTPAFGRGETFTVNGKEITVCLVKNPAGFNQGLKSFVTDQTDEVLIAINDNYADGRDVSWLWDVNFDSLRPVKHLITSGVRAFDIALRLHYDLMPIEHVKPDLEEAVEHIILRDDKRRNVVIFPTYTAMLSLRKLLAKHTKVDPIW